MIFGARAHDYDIREPRALFARVAADGFSAVQLAPFKSFGWQYPLTGAQTDAIARASSETGVRVTVLGAYRDLALPEADARAAELRMFLNALPACAALRALCVGTETTRFAGDDAARAAAFDRLCGSLETALAQAEQWGVTVGVEPVFDHVLNAPELVARLLARLPSPRLRVIFDPVNITPHDENTNLRALYDRCLDAFGAHICAVHVKGFRFQNHRKTPCPLWEGLTDWAYLLPSLRRLHPQLPLLREESPVAHAPQELTFLRALMG